MISNLISIDYHCHFLNYFIIFLWEEDKSLIADNFSETKALAWQIKWAMLYIFLAQRPKNCLFAILENLSVLKKQEWIWIWKFLQLIGWLDYSLLRPNARFQLFMKDFSKKYFGPNHDYLDLNAPKFKSSRYWINLTFFHRCLLHVILYLCSKWSTLSASHYDL